MQNFKIISLDDNDRDSHRDKICLLHHVKALAKDWGDADNIFILIKKYGKRSLGCHTKLDMKAGLYGVMKTFGDSNLCPIR